MPIAFDFLIVDQEDDYRSGHVFQEKEKRKKEKHNANDQAREYLFLNVLLFLCDRILNSGRDDDPQSNSVE